MVDGIREPGDGELDLPIAGFDVGWVFGVPGLGPVACCCTLSFLFQVREGEGEGELPLRVIPISPPSLALNSSR